MQFRVEFVSRIQEVVSEAREELKAEGEVLGFGDRL